MSNYTKGPWAVQQSHNVLWIGKLKEGSESMDDIVLHINYDKDYKTGVKLKMKANAALVAAAPELLDVVHDLAEALNLALSRLGCQTEDAALRSDNDSFGGLNVLEEARRVIRKATTL